MHAYEVFEGRYLMLSVGFTITKSRCSSAAAEFHCGHQMLAISKYIYILEAKPMHLTNIVSTYLFMHICILKMHLHSILLAVTHSESMIK